MKPIQFLTIIFTCLCYSQSAVAYLDPGTGSLILQMLIAGIMGSIFTIKLYWYQLKTFITKLFGHKKKNEHDQNDDNNSDKK